MRLAFDYQAFAMQTYGGISRYYSILARELLNEDQDVSVFAGFHRNNYLSTLRSDVVKGWKLGSYPPRTNRIFQYLNHGICEAQTRILRPDLVHETYYSALPRVASNVIRVASVYDMIHELFSSQFSSNDKTTEWKKKTFERVDHIISISESTKKDLVDLFGIDDTKISVVHLGVDFDSFRNARKKLVRHTTPYVLYVGSRAGYKNFNGFLKACAASVAVKNKVKILAFGGGGFDSSEHALISSLGFNPGIVEQVSGNDEMLASLYAEALCFVYPSLYEGFGLPPLEAMASGCPVVSSNTSSMPEVINDAAMYFNPNDIEEMSNAIEVVVLDNALRAKLISLGYENIKLFSWQKCAAETLEVYKKLTGKT